MKSSLLTKLEALADRSHFTLQEPRLTAYAILAMLTGVATWHRADGRLPLEKVIELHTHLVFNGLAGSSSPA